MITTIRIRMREELWILGFKWSIRPKTGKKMWNVRYRGVGQTFWKFSVGARVVANLPTWLSIHLTYELTRAYTEKVCPGQVRLVTHEAAPRTNQRPPSKHDKGPPLSPLQTLLPCPPTHTMELSSTVPPFLLRQVLWLATGALACLRRGASAFVFEFILPQPE